MQRQRFIEGLIIGIICSALSSASAAEKSSSKEKRAKEPTASSAQTTSPDDTATPQTTTTRASSATPAPVITTAPAATPAPAVAEQLAEGVVKNLEIKSTTATMVVKKPDGTEWAVTVDPALSLVQQDGKTAPVNTLRVGQNVRVHYTVKSGQPVIRVVDILPYQSVTGAVVSTTSR